MASALINEVASAKSFFSLIASDGPMRDQVAKNFADAVIWQVNNCLVMPLHDATLLIHALKESPYADADIKRITAAIDAKVMMHQSSKADPDPDKFPLPTSSEHEVLDEPKAEKKGLEMDEGIPLMPNESKDGNPAPVHYRWGVIYTYQDKWCFVFDAKGGRSKNHKGHRYCSLYRSWGLRRTKQEAWDDLIATIQAPKK